MSDNKSNRCNDAQLTGHPPKVSREPTSVLSRPPFGTLALEVLANSAHLLMRRSVNVLAMPMIMLVGTWLAVPANASVPRHRAPTHAHPAAIAPSHSATAHPSAHKKVSHPSPGTTSARAHTPAHSKLASAKAAGRRGRRHKLAPQEDQLSETIPAVPLRHAKFALPAPMRGSRESLVRQNILADSEGLERIENDEDLERMIQEKDLVTVPANGALRVNESLPANRRYCRNWTATFLTDLSRVHYQRFRRPIMVTSAVRTAEYQRQLQHVNGNAAPAEGDLASPHLTGATIDIAKKGLSLSEIGWMRAYLLPLQSTGKIDVEEEFQQACFHITVYKSYQPPQTDNAVNQAANSRSLMSTRLR